MDIRIKLAILPFTYFEFYNQNFVQKLSHNSSSFEYRKKLEEFSNNVLPYIHQTERIEQIDEVNLLLEKFYSYKSIMKSTDSGEKIYDFHLNRIHELSQLFITHRNGNLALKYWESTSEKQNSNTLFSAYSGINKVALWSSLSRMMCTDIICMYYLISNGIKDEQSLISYDTLLHLPDTQLDGILKKGLAETHMHFSASGNFNFVWKTLMNPNPEIFTRKNSYIDNLTGKAENIDMYILCMATLRLIMMKYLVVSDEHSKFSEFLEFYFPIYEFPEIKRLIECILKGHDLKLEGYTKEFLFEVFEEIKFRFSSLKKKANSISLDYEMFNSDILACVTDKSINFTSLENIFLFKSIKYLLKSNDNVFANIFWKYILVKNQKFSSLVQKNHIRGLPYFLSYFDNSTNIELSKNEIEKWEFLLRYQLKNKNLKKLEIRIAPPKKNNVPEIKTELLKKMEIFFSAYMKVLREISKDNPQENVPQIGIVIHFIKKKDEHHLEKCWLDYNENERNNEKLNHKKNQLQYIKEMIAIREVREEIVGLAEYIVGIDAANLETATEPWVFAPIFAQARNSNTHQLIYSSSASQQIKTLGLTFHAGEDFRHMLTGLRYIDEAIEHFQMRAGDRIGHGMVLGVNIKHWSARNQIIILPRIEYLENLLWVWGMCKSPSLLSKIDTGFLEHRILKVAEEIFESSLGLSAYLLWKVYRSKFKTEIGDEFPTLSEPEKENWVCHQFDKTMFWDENKLSNTYHCKCYLIKMNEPIEVKISVEEQLIIEEMQNLVRKKVGMEGIVVETNPTSNTAIGEIENIFEHYIYNLNRTGLSNSQTLAEHLMVTINTDDPIVFNTNINNEFAYIFYSLYEKGHSREEILNWIDQIRENGINSSFVSDKNYNFATANQTIDKVLKEIRIYLYGDNS